MNQPTPTNSPRFTPQGLIPTAEQTAIQLAQNKVVLVDANAGAAKTTTLALRIGEALTRGLGPEQILALTFTPEAREVLRRRLLEVGVARATVERIAVLSFEDFSAWMLDLTDGDNVRQCHEARALKNYALQAMDYAGERYAGSVDGLELHTHSLALSQFLDVQLNLKATMALDSDVEFMGPEEAAEVLGVPLTDYLTTLEYERMRLDGGAGAVFRGPFDATYDLACNLHGGGRLAEQFPDYRLVLCDELHDLNEAAFRILDALIDRPQCYFVGAGDKDQVIHAKLGASDEYLNRRFAERYPKLQRYPLTQTWRHGPHLAYAMAEFKQKQVESSLPLRTEIRQAHYTSAAECALRVVAAVREWKADGYDIDGCAILIRDRHQSMEIENALIEADIDYRTPPMAGYLQRDEILFLRGLLAIALKDFAAVKSDQVRTAIVDALVAFSEMKFSAHSMDNFKQQIVKSPDLLGELFMIEDERRDGVEPSYRDVASVATKRAVISALAWLSDVDPATPAATVLSELCERVQLATTARRIFVRAYDASVINKSIASLLAAAASSGQSLREFWNALNAREAFVRRKRDRKSVLIECAANAKGKEFDHVILPFLQDGEFPHPLQPKREEENLFYVAATRARARLTLLSPSDTAQRSSFIAQLRLPKSSAAAEAALERNERAPVAAPAARHYLTAGYNDKDQVKALGAKFDIARRAWYVESDTDLKPFAPWLKK
ncbi:DNA helicase-2 / ATP-dependent DNA helicase PcrA [Duganella sp. CF402]|uniref:ATP-dependent helicase n=1 Tax=unclassified Duganella TaxID=2636909 RepID=UPI0008AC52BD|nr:MULTISPECIES: ATP-dependent helicase [unclassified Duganella]RZT10610.1 DNA helicase-2/ATP-dependent DNA helicase PcrA [Duganella sp. BK701]SEL06138.1 DNA helicase-2 / ATP-dependent DNA helicase PcrA [Duganella sp. CF402]